VNLPGHVSQDGWKRADVTERSTVNACASTQLPIHGYVILHPGNVEMIREIHDGVIAMRPPFWLTWRLGRGALTDVRMSRSFLKAELKSKQIKTI